MRYIIIISIIYTIVNNILTTIIWWLLLTTITLINHHYIVSVYIWMYIYIYYVIYIYYAIYTYIYIYTHTYTKVVNLVSLAAFVAFLQHFPGHLRRIAPHVLHEESRCRARSHSRHQQRRALLGAAPVSWLTGGEIHREIHGENEEFMVCFIENLDVKCVFWIKPLDFSSKRWMCEGWKLGFKQQSERNIMGIQFTK